MKRKFVWPGILLAIGMVLLPACSKKKAEQKDWFSRAQMGMSSAQVREILPDMKIAEGGEESHTSRRLFEQYITTGQDFDGLQGCRLELRFLDDRLWVILVNYEDNPTEEVERILKERYGEPTQQYGNVARWSGSGLEVVLDRDAKYFSFGDEARAKEAAKAAFPEYEDGEGVTGGHGDE
jgi:hypothetical protein